MTNVGTGTGEQSLPGKLFRDLAVAPDEGQAPARVEDLRLARTGEHQVVAVLGHFNKTLLHRVLRVVDDAAERHLGCRKVQEVVAAFEPLAQETASQQRETGVDELADLVGTSCTQPGVLVHHVGLQRSFPMEVLKGREVVLVEEPLDACRVSLDGHCRPEYLAALVKFEKAVVVHVRERG